MSASEDRLDSVLTDYERRKQDETRRQVQRALRLEEARKRGVEALRKYAIKAARDVASRLQGAGHRVLHQEFLDAYPPYIRIHLWPKPGPIEAEGSRQSSLDLVWGDPEPDTLFAKRLTSDGQTIQGSAGARPLETQGVVLFTHDPAERHAPGDILDDLWVKEQLLMFVQETLEDA